MRKSTLFVSAALTTFMLAIMVGVASAYQKALQSGTSKESAQQTQTTEVTAADPAAAATLTLEQAAALASNVIGRTDLYSAENTQLDGNDAYLITFSSGDLVYVSLDGKIMSISKLPVVFIASQSSSHAGGGGGGSGNNGGNNVSSAPPSSNNDGGNDTGDDDGGGDD